MNGRKVFFFSASIAVGIGIVLILVFLFILPAAKKTATGVPNS